MSSATTQPVGLPEEPNSGRGWGSTLVRLLIAVAVLGGIYVGAAFYLDDRPPSGVSVAGVSIGLLPEDEARATLERELADRLSVPLTVRLPAEDQPGGAPGSVEIEVVPEKAGLDLDLDRTLDGVTGFSLDPRRLWQHVTGDDRELQLYGSVEREALLSALRSQAQDYDREAVDGDVELTDDGLDLVEPVRGRSLDVEDTADVVAQAWESQTFEEGAVDEHSSRTVAGAASSSAPELTAAEIERFTTEELEPALAEPVAVTATRDEGEDEEQSATAELSERDLRSLLVVEQEGDRLSLTLDEEALWSRARQDLGQLEAGPRDATVRLDGSSVEVVPASQGYALVQGELGGQVREALGAGGDGRTVEVEVEDVMPGISTDTARDWTFEEMGSFSSAFPTGQDTEERTQNLHTGVGYLNGYVVMPGQQFSLGAALGDISEEGGYAEAPVVMDGRTVMGMGGGLSQISTVVFNTSWSSGVQLDAHTPHSMYFPRYPAGREATLSYPVIDNRWTNDTDTPVVVRAWISGTEIHMAFLGDRRYEVQTVDGERRDVTEGQEHEGEEQEDDSDDCVAQAASDGFTITTVRILREGGAEVGRDEFTTTYQPADAIVCTET